MDKNKTIKKEDLLKVTKTAVITEDAIYEMVYDKQQGETSFVKKQKYGKLDPYIEEVEADGVLYVPIQGTNALLRANVILFPSLPAPYKDEKEILDEVRDFIHKYLDISEVFEQIATYYVLFTWLYDKFNEVPYLRAIGDYGSGKSRFIQTIGSICYKPIITSGVSTPSPIFRIINDIKGTLIIDEADFSYSDMSSEMIKILNTGYQKGMPVLRSEGKGTFEIKAYDVFCPKIVATRGTFTDKALESRFLIEEMGHGMRSDIPRTLDDNFYRDAENIRNKLLMWRLNNYFEPINLNHEPIKGVHPRLNQIVIPLLSIIKDEGIKENLKEFIIKYNSEMISDRGQTWESDIVLAILRLQNENQGISLTVKAITDEVNNDKDIDDETLHSRKVGWYLREKLRLKLARKNNGFTLSLRENSKKIQVWKSKFGITDEEIKGECVNVENVAKDIKEQIINNI